MCEELIYLFDFFVLLVLVAIGFICGGVVFVLLACQIDLAGLIVLSIGRYALVSITVSLSVSMSLTVLCL